MAPNTWGSCTTKLHLFSLFHLLIFIFAYPFFNDKRYDYLNNYFYTPQYLEDIVIPDRVVIDFVVTKKNKLLTSFVSPKIKNDYDFLADHLTRKSRLT